MALDFNKTLMAIQDCLGNDKSISENMEYIISVCEEDTPHQDWVLLRRLGYHDTNSMKKWLSNVLVTEKPNFIIKGLYFGLFNPIVNDKPTADIYICGSSIYDEDDIDEWTCDPEYWPEKRHANSSILGDIYNIAYASDDSLGNDVEYPLCLGYGCLLVKHLLTAIDAKILRDACADNVAIAVGFDSGDYIMIKP